jgi:gas vesicle protein
MNVVARSMRITAAGAVIGALALAGCSSSSKSSSGTSTSTTSGGTAICTSFDNFKTSLKDLANPTTFTGGKAGIQSALDEVKTNLDDVKSTVKSSDKPKVEELQSSITDLQKAVDNMSGVSGISDVATAAKNVGTSAQAVLSVVQAGCPTS